MSSRPTPWRTALGPACDGGQLDACTVLGGVLLRPQHARRDPERAAAVFSKACDGGAMTACANLGMALVRGEACTLGSQTACQMLASAKAKP